MLKNSYCGNIFRIMESKQGVDMLLSEKQKEVTPERHSPPFPTILLREKEKKQWNLK